MERDTSLGFHQEDSTGERNSFGHTVTAGHNTAGGTTSTEKDMFALNGLMDSIIDYEKQLMQQRSQLFMQVWKDRKLYQEFIEFMSYSKSPRFILILNIVYTIFFLTPLTTLFLFRDELSITSLWLGSIEFFFASLTMVCGWTLYASIEEISPIRVVGRKLFHLKTKSDWRLFSDRVQFVLYLSLVMRHGITLVRRTLSGRCDRNTFLYLWTCNPQDSTNTFPLDSASLLMIIPILFCVVYREARIGVNIIAFLIVLFSLIYCSILLNSSQPLVISSGYFILSLVVMIDSLKQFILFYWLGRQLKKTIETNQTLAEENKATEMRHMIANVAHDMKTPLSSFMTGIDIMADDVLTFQRKFESLSSPTEKDEGRFDTNSIPSFLSNLKTCIENIRNTNSFMLMTINRCLDYTKASNGMKLVPKYETIDFEETLKLPLQCMANIQQRIKISLLPYDDQKICSHIITDKQWLQENILCLLSNAVKYSTGGEALIKVTLHKVKESQTRFFSDPKIPCFNEEDPASLNIAFNSGDESSFITFPSRSRIKLPKFSFPIPWFTRTIQKHAKVLPSPIHTNHGVSYDHSPAKTTRTPRGTEHTATISSHSSTRIDMELVFEVIDNGIGISEDAMKSLFNPFKQTQRLAGGTGLGLYSLAKRIEALKGKYGVHKREDGKQGSVFWFAVPYKADEITATMTKQYKEVNGNTLRASQQGKQGSPGNDISFMVRQNSLSPRESLSILLAEDTPSIAKMTSMMLKRQNHNTDVAENGQIVLDKLFPTITTTTTSDSPKKDSPSSSRQQKPHQTYDVVLMDLQMPVMDGLEATRRIRAYEREIANESPHRLPPRQIVIGVSANSDNETMEEAFQAGVDDFLPKPFSINLFNEVIKRIHK